MKKFIRPSPDEVKAKLEELAHDYEELKAILDAKEPLFDAAKDELLVAIQSGDWEGLLPEVKTALENAVISKLTIEEKNALTRLQYPALTDTITRTQKMMKRIEKSFEHYRAIDISNQSSRKQEMAVGGYRP